MRFARLGAPCALAAALTLVGPAPAAAQDIMAQVLMMEGRASVDLADLATTMAQPISLGECEDSAQISFRFTMVDATRPNLRFFAGTGCDDPAVRNDTTNASCTDLELQFATESRSQVDVTLGADQLIDCSGSSGVENLWVLAIENETSAVTGAGQKVSFPIAYDFVGPAAPGGLTATGGETAATLTWEGASGQVTEYEVYFVPGGCSGGSPTTTIDPATSEPYATIEGTNSSYSVVFPESAPIGSQSAIAIRAIDRTGNASELSATVCVDRIEVTSWWDSHCGGGGGTDACSGMEGCAAAPGRPASGWLAGIAMLAAALALVRSRRNR